MGEIEEQIEPDMLVKSVVTEIQQLLKKKGPIDESTAKRIRRDWDSVDSTKLGDQQAYESAKLLMEELREVIHRQVQRRDKQYARLVDDIEKLEKAVKDGNLKLALPLDQSTSERIKQLGGLSEQRRTAADERLKALGPEIKVLKQWRHWGTTQARETIIAEVEALIDSKQSPTKTAREVQQARATWKSWDKTGDTSPKALWSKFDDVCTRAYLPCQQHFNKLAEQRKDNLKKRESICAALESIESETDWKAPQWRDLDKQIRELVGNWRRTGTVDRGKRKSLDVRYGAIYEKLDARFDRERTRNVKQRAAMTQEVVALKQSDDVHGAISRVKEIQKQWRPSVLADRREERKLWQEFKSACDDIFAERDSERKTQNAEQDKNRDARHAFLQKLEKDTEADDQVVLDLSNRVDRLRQKWQEAGPVSPKHRSGLDKQFHALLKKLGSRAGQLQRKRDKEVDVFIASIDALLTPYELSIIQHDVQAPNDALDTCWPDISVVPQPTRGSLQSRHQTLSRALDGDGSSASQLKKHSLSNAEARQQICLKLEVAADIDSPPEFSKSRMQWQVDRLKKAMSGAGPDNNDKAKSDDTQTLLREYWACGPVATDVSKALDTRFNNICQSVAPELKINLNFESYLKSELVEGGISQASSLSEETDEEVENNDKSDVTEDEAAEAKPDNTDNKPAAETPGTDQPAQDASLADAKDDLSSVAQKDDADATEPSSVDAADQDKEDEERPETAKSDNTNLTANAGSADTVEEKQSKEDESERYVDTSVIPGS